MWEKRERKFGRQGTKFPLRKKCCQSKDLKEFVCIFPLVGDEIVHKRWSFDFSRFY